MLQVETNSNCVEVYEEKHDVKMRTYFEVSYEELKTFIRNMNSEKKALSAQE